MDKLLSTDKVADYLDVNPITVRRKAQNGELPSIKIGNRLRFDKQQIDRWLKQMSDGKTMQILVVDDEPLIRKLFKDNLTGNGHQVTTATSSLKAMKLIGNRHFDLIFLDLIMPEFDGAELLRHIRQSDKTIPVAIITGHPDSKLLNKAMAYGPFTVMKKPFNSKDILATVRSFL
ncbi:response regulator [Chloroflexota bacterium]